jgi:hypothetical protein
MYLKIKAKFKFGVFYTYVIFFILNRKYFINLILIFNIQKLILFKKIEEVKLNK